MNIFLPLSQLVSGKTLQLSGSKSESNRALLLQAFFPELQIKNLSTADDTLLLQRALQSEEATIDIHHAGTAMRFLTAYFATQVGREVLLTGSARMKERPIHLLVEALQRLGADIRYGERAGFPPLYIKGVRLNEKEVRIRGDVSSQFLSSLLLIAPSLPNGLTLILEGELTSVPYLKMTVSFLQYCLGEEVVQWEGNVLKVASHINKPLKNNIWEVESDWSSASYWFSFVALSPIGTQLTLTHFKEDSLQGDSALPQLYKHFGVSTTFKGSTMHIEKTALPYSTRLEFQLNNTPDIAQTIAVTALGLGLEAHLSGLHTLKIKETDRLQALQAEMTKLGATMNITDESLHLAPCKQLREGVSIATYNDHRMAMAFAPLMLKTPIVIEDKEVVSKSYPEFWEQAEEVSGVRFQGRDKR